MYDVIVVGARVAGSPTALLLARRGYRVLLVDRSSFPQDTVSTLLIQLPGVARLAHWNVLDHLVATGCPPIHRFRFDFGPVILNGTPGPFAGQSASYAPRRIVLDRLLLDAAAQAGAEVREGYAIQDLLWEGNRVVGVRGQDATGRLRSERGRIVVGADGRNSLIARAVAQPMYHALPPLTVAYYAFWSGLPMANTGEAYIREGRAVIALPTHDDQTLVSVQWPHREFSDIRTDIGGNFMRSLELAPGLAARVHAARRESRFAGAADLPNFFRKPFGPGWALVGDAGHHRDPALGHGISDAFRDAELLATAIDAGLQNRTPMKEALADYQRLRDSQARPLYELITQLARLESPSPQLRNLLGVIANRPDEINRFVAATAGTLPVADVFGAENVAHQVGASAQ